MGITTACVSTTPSGKKTHRMFLPTLKLRNNHDHKKLTYPPATWLHSTQICPSKAPNSKSMGNTRNAWTCLNIGPSIQSLCNRTPSRDRKLSAAFSPLAIATLRTMHIHLLLPTLRSFLGFIRTVVSNPSCVIVG
jgi:hypothetical protein